MFPQPRANFARCFSLSLIFFTFLHLCAEAGVCDNDGRSVTVKGRFPAESCRYEYLVSIKHPTFNTHLCSATVIEKNYLLTAASCLAGVSNAKACINGYYRDGSFEKKITIEEVKVHPNYSGANSPFDVAVAKLSGSAPSPKIKYAKKNETPSKGTTVAVVGWGRRDPQGALSDIMQARKDYKISPSACSSLSVASGLICAGKANVNICEGDLGGPLIKLGNNEASDLQVGIISGAIGDCNTNKQPGLFIDVSDVADWIESIT